MLECWNVGILDFSTSRLLDFSEFAGCVTARLLTGLENLAGLWAQLRQLLNTPMLNAKC